MYIFLTITILLLDLSLIPFHLLQTKIDHIFLRCPNGLADLIFNSNFSNIYCENWIIEALMKMTVFLLKQRNCRFVLLSNIVFLKESSDPEHTFTVPKTLCTFVCIYSGKINKLCSYFKVWGGVWFLGC